MTLIVFMSHCNYLSFVILSNPECLVDEAVRRKINELHMKERASSLCLVLINFTYTKQCLLITPHPLLGDSVCCVKHIFKRPCVCMCVQDEAMWTCQSDRRWLSGEYRLVLRVRRYYVDANMQDHLQSFLFPEGHKRQMSLPFVRPHATHINRLSPALPTSAKEKREVLLASWDSVCMADTFCLHRV